MGFFFRSIKNQFFFFFFFERTWLKITSPLELKNDNEIRIGNKAFFMITYLE